MGYLEGTSDQGSEVFVEFRMFLIFPFNIID
jgi:hypothetical protein